MLKNPLPNLLMAAVLYSGSAEAASTDSFGFWNQDVAQGSFGLINPDLQRLRWWVEGQARVFDQLDHVSQGLARGAVGYNLLDDGKYNVSFWTGYTWNPSRLDGKKPVDEHDIFPALAYSANTGVGTISGRSMADFRFTDTGANTGYRYRQMLRFTHPLAFGPRLSLVAWDEVMFNLNNTDWGQKTGIDQNRVFAGVGWNFDKNFRVETGYFNWFLNIHNPHPGTDTVHHMLAVNFQANF